MPGKMKLMVEVTHRTDGSTEYEELKSCCERIARWRGRYEGELKWYDALQMLMQEAEHGGCVTTSFAEYRLVVEVQP